MSDRDGGEDVADRLTAVEDAVANLVARVDAFGTVSDETTSTAETYAAVLELAFETAGDSETISMGPHEIRECTDVSRRYAYEPIDAMGTSLSGCEIRKSGCCHPIQRSQSSSAPMDSR